MAKKKVNKTDLIREILGKNPSATGKQISDSLSKKGYKVSVAYAGAIKSKLKSRKRNQTLGNETVSISALLKAKDLCEELGGVERARLLLDAVERLQ